MPGVNAPVPKRFHRARKIFLCGATPRHQGVSAIAREPARCIDALFNIAPAPATLRPRGLPRAGEEKIAAGREGGRAAAGADLRLTILSGEHARQRHALVLTAFALFVANGRYRVTMDAARRALREVAAAGRTGQQARSANPTGLP
ncbi:hypothetical protein [Aquibium sp. ELW1220]|uniref:hypothetical protein n=1 Tax=Aquibium sp. ELW1220 TaxID=2976766 RepID=UPI0025B05E5B|nr:hypothetical protein [Aquibium sp. ELW1220]MDN2581255.1 hypothetical protein [Aquibium sp. ELW1220]